MPSEFFKNIYNLYLDITDYFGYDLKKAIRDAPATRRLCDGISAV